MPTQEQITQFLATTIVPLVTGALVTWLSSTKVLALFNLTATSAAKVIGAVLVFGVSAGIAYLSSHHILAGHYTPAAKAKASAS